MDDRSPRKAPHPRRTRSELIGTAEWVEPTVVELQALSQADLATYRTRKLALELYRKNAPGAQIEKESKLTITQVGRLHRLGAKLNPATKKPRGYYVCLPGRRLDTKKHRRKNPFDSQLAENGRGLKNALSDFFARHDDIKRLLDNYLRTRRIGQAAPEPRINAASAVRAFHKLCRAKKLHEQVPLQWPFNRRRLGENAVREYYATWKVSNPRLAALNELGESAAQEHAVDAAVAANAVPELDAPLLVYGRIEVDGILLPAIGSVLFKNKYGVEVQVETRRLYALLARDCRLPLILGARASFGLRYDVNDVLGLARDSLFPPAKRKLTIVAEEFGYRQGADYPARVLPGLWGNVWQELAWDADSAHLSASDSRLIEDLLRCRVASERIGSPTARALIENLYSFLSAAFEVLSSATGTNPDDPVRRNPAGAATKYCIRIELLEELLDVWARNWNATYRQELGMTPLDAAKQLADQYEVFYNPLGALSETDRRHEFFPRFRRELRYSRVTHGVLLVNLFGAKYSGPDLVANARLASTTNRRCTVYVNDQDAREAWVVPDAYPEMRLHVFVQNRALLRFPHPLLWRRMTSWWTAGQGRQDRAIRPDIMRAAAEYFGEQAREGDPNARAIFSTIIGEQARVEAGATSSIVDGMGDDEHLQEPVLDAEEAEEGEVDPEHESSPPVPRTDTPKKLPRKRSRAPGLPLPPAASTTQVPRIRGGDLGLGL